MDIRYYHDPETGLPHIYGHGVTEAEVEWILARPGEDDACSADSRQALGQRGAGGGGPRAPPPGGGRGGGGGGCAPGGRGRGVVRPAPGAGERGGGGCPPRRERRGYTTPSPLKRAAAQAMVVRRRWLVL